MTQQSESTVPKWYWLIAAVALLWNLMGCMAFAMELFAQEAVMKTWSDAQKEWARSIPTWIYFVYGLAVFTGVAGSVGLFLRREWSMPLFAVSLGAVLVQMVYTILIEGGLQVMGPSSLIMPAVVIVIGAVLLWFSWLAKGKVWLSA